jgi:nitric oxide reductase NorE protein
VSSEPRTGALADPFRDPFDTPDLHAIVAKASRRRLRGHVPGEVGVWVFIFGDLLAFTLFFSVFMYERAHDRAVFEASRRTLELTFGAVNTLLLLTGSLFVALAVRAARQGRTGIGPRLLGPAVLCGAGFVVNKALEYAGKIDAGHTPAQNDFYMYFFAFTGVHLLHLLLGILVLAIMWRITRKPALTATDLRNLEAGACYWHLVDVLWLVLFALLYLVR